MHQVKMTSSSDAPAEQSEPTTMLHNNGPLQSSDSSIHEVAAEKRTATDDWKPSPGIYVAFLTLCVITLMVALDGTSLSVALPVSLNPSRP